MNLLFLFIKQNIGKINLIINNYLSSWVQKVQHLMTWPYVVGKDITEVEACDKRNYLLPIRMKVDYRIGRWTPHIASKDSSPATYVLLVCNSIVYTSFQESHTYWRPRKWNRNLWNNIQTMPHTNTTLNRKI